MTTTQPRRFQVWLTALAARSSLPISDPVEVAAGSASP